MHDASHDVAGGSGVRVRADDRGRAGGREGTGDKAFTDAEFVNKAASGGMHEIELGMLAKTNAANAEVKGFGERMVKDHTTLADWLKTAAKGANLTVPSKVSEADQKEV